LLLALVASIASAGRLTTFSWDADANWPVGITVELCGNGNVCQTGLTGTQVTLDLPVTPGEVIQGRARAHAPDGTSSEWTTATQTWPILPVGLWVRRETAESYMSATHISATQTQSDSSTTSINRTGVAVNAGDLIVVFDKWEDGDATLTVTDNASGGSNTYTNLTKRSVTGNVYGQLAWAVAKATETLTVTCGISPARPYKRLHVHVARPASGYSFQFDAEAGAAGSSNSPSTGAFTVAGGTGYAVVAVGEYTVVQYTPGSGWTEAIDSNSFSAYRLLTTETSITGNATCSGNMDWVAVAGAWKTVSTGGAATALPRRALDGPFYGALRGSVR
jgi:hypothetical protein